MGEFDLIRQVFMPVAAATASPSVRLGPGDDCAVQRLPPGTELAFSIDTLVEGVHFPKQYPPRYLGWRSLAAAASDLAAMGADPVCFTLALTLPASDPVWLTEFAAGLQEAATAFGLGLAGGDTTRGPLAICIQVHGTVPQGKALLRSGAQAGDLVCVSGTLGDAGAALQWLDRPSVPVEAEALLDRYHHPVPQIALGRALRGRATSAIDVSDGLVADLGHILAASGVGAHLISDAIPRSPALLALHGPDALSLALSAGDDYELCFTIPVAAWDSLNHNVGSPLAIIGEITDSPGLWLDDGRLDHGAVGAGYNHFGARE